MKDDPWNRYPAGFDTVDLPEHDSEGKNDLRWILLIVIGGFALVEGLAWLLS